MQARTPGFLQECRDHSPRQPTGHIVYALEGSLLAIVFDADTLEVGGVAVSIFINARQPR